MTKKTAEAKTAICVMIVLLLLYCIALTVYIDKTHFNVMYCYLVGRGG